jgi:hypothetical protein
LAPQQLTAMAKASPVVLAHQEWLGFVQPTGLVVSPMALERAGIVLPRNDRDSQARLQAVTDGLDSSAPRIRDFEVFARTVLRWSWKTPHFAGTADHPIPDELRHHLEDFEETLSPDFAVADRSSAEGATPWQLLVRVLPTGQRLDEPVKGSGRLEASQHSRLERLLRAVEVPAGILFNGEVLRLVSAPRGESSGWIDFRVADMVQPAGRPVCAAMVLLLAQERLLTGAASKRLPALLVESRKYQNEVSEKLAEQVLHALYELLRGLEAADARSDRTLLREIRRERPDEVYHGLLTVLLRMVFLLYAEERGMLPADPVFAKHYSIAGLHRRLTADAALHPDTMDQRFGAWAQLVVLFRMIHDGARTGDFELPARHGVLFEPDRFPFLEGRSGKAPRQKGELLDYPRIADGTIHRALEKLLVLDGERLSYRALDVEQIGSVYETMMGFRIETATGTSIAIKAQKKGGAPTTVDLDALLAVGGNKRKKWLEDKTDRELTKTVVDLLEEASTLEELHAALDRVLDKAATPDLVPKDSLVLQPSEARRKSGSHYTPRELTEPIVRTTLRPVLERLRDEAGGPPTPEQILDLKVCDPAMGSGAFLVEACRQLGDVLIEAWIAHDCKPPIPADEDEIVHARRLVAQRCLYGVDRNPVAVDLAKVSLWLATLARDHAFTFVDHALRHGDSLVGLTNAQIAARDWSNEEPLDSPKYRQLKANVDEVGALRRQIREAGDEAGDWELRDLLDEAENKANEVRTWADLVIEAFFSSDKDKDRERALGDVAKRIAAGVHSGERARLDKLRRNDPPLAAFHWGLEFPEVFDRERPGMDALVGNPPFLGGVRIGLALGSSFVPWIKVLHEGTHGNADLAAHFFRRAFSLCRTGGTIGLVATNSVAQGDTRTTGLGWICAHGGVIFDARRRLKWPGRAAVVVSVVHLIRANAPLRGRFLDGRAVEVITAYLFHRGASSDPARLRKNGLIAFKGPVPLGMGFTFDDSDKNGVASSVTEMQRIVASNPGCRPFIFPYLGGDEINQHPKHEHHRYVINFGERSEAECWSACPELMAVLDQKVRPERERNSQESRRKYWWRFDRLAPALAHASAAMDRVLVHAFTSSYVQFALVPTSVVVSGPHCVFAESSFASFAALQSRPHELWARFFGSSMKDDLRYTPSDCFETFPFPEEWQTHPELESAGRDYYDFRAQLMVATDLGLTKTYNRFHDPDEKNDNIVRLRELHAAMDRAVLNAYGWTDIPTDCDFLLDYEDDDGSSRRKKPWRYRWPDEVRDEVLARLLELNARRAEEERLAGLGSRKGARKNAEGESLFD